MVDEVAVLAGRLTADFPTVPEPADRIWTATPAEKVIDCVLSLNRRYDSFVVPRVAECQSANPAVSSVQALHELIESYPSPAAFSERELRLSDSARASTLLGVAAFLVRATSSFPGEREEVRLRAWAEDARPGDYLGGGIKGFALAGWQYLRMLFGANTAKPDVHVIRYVSEVLKRDVSPPEALYLLEAATDRMGCSLRKLDVAIWERAARPGAL